MPFSSFPTPKSTLIKIWCWNAQAAILDQNPDIKFRQAIWAKGWLAGSTPQHRRSVGLVARGRFGRTEGGIDFGLNAPGRQRRQPRLRSAGLDLVAKLEPPFPDVRFGGRHDGVSDVLVNHGNFPVPDSGRTTFSDF